MRELAVKNNRSVEPPLVGRKVALGTVSRRVEPGVIIRCEESGRPLIVFGRYEQPHTRVKRHLPHIRYTEKDRLTRRNNDYDSVKAADRQFGYVPNRPVFNLAAAPAKLNAEEPLAYHDLQNLGLEMMQLYRQHNPDTYTEQERKTATIKPCWKMPGTFFTQGIINDTVMLDFHYDRGNIKGCWSCMSVFLRGVKGGELVVPAIDLALAVDDETYVFFDGQALLHGVAPVEKTTSKGRRFSVVYYAIKAMERCGTPQEELERMRRIDVNKHRKATSK